MPKKNAIIRTFSGIDFDVFNPEENKINLYDIAHALSNLCRWGGHTKKFYSVAQHSVICTSLFKTKKEKLQALFHDAAEAYLMDIPSPIKEHLREYHVWERDIMFSIASYFGFEWPMSVALCAVDYAVLAREAMDIMDFELIGTSKIVIPPITDFWTPYIAEENFLKCFYEINEMNETDE